MANADVGEGEDLRVGGDVDRRNESQYMVGGGGGAPTFRAGSRMRTRTMSRSSSNRSTSESTICIVISLKYIVVCILNSKCT